MAALPRPHAEDVVIRRKSAGTFAIDVHAPTPHIACSTLGEALQRAVSLAAAQRGQVWYTTERHRCAPLADAKLLGKIWNEYAEMPGLRLTREQAQRLWAINAQLCAPLLDQFRQALPVTTSRALHIASGRRDGQ